MENRRLSSEELMKANELLSFVRAWLDRASGGDRELRLALNRKVYKELSYDKRSKPIVRRKLKREKWEAQDRKCAECGKRDGAGLQRPGSPSGGREIHSRKHPNYPRDVRLRRSSIEGIQVAGAVAVNDLPIATRPPLRTKKNRFLSMC
jgi:hypothetical protein